MAQETQISSVAGSKVHLWYSLLCVLGGLLRGLKIQILICEVWKKPMFISYDLQFMLVPESGNEQNNARFVKPTNLQDQKITTIYGRSLMYTQYDAFAGINGQIS